MEVICTRFEAGSCIRCPHGGWHEYDSGDHGCMGGVHLCNGGEVKCISREEIEELRIENTSW